MSIRPKGKCEAVYLIPRKPSDLGVSARVVVKDDEGKLFEFPACYFVRDLSPFCDKQELEFSSWASKVKGGLYFYEADKVTDAFLDKHYREGVAVDDAINLARASIRASILDQDHN